MCLTGARVVRLTSLLPFLIITPVGTANAFRLEIVSVTSNGTQAHRDSHLPSVSADGRFVAFRSGAGLVPGAPSGPWRIYVHDRRTRQLRLVSVSSAGVPANRQTTYLSISADGRFVAFDSSATNLVQRDTNETTDVFVHDLHTGETSRASLRSHGGEANACSLLPSISADGRYVAFYSAASNLVAGDTNGWPDVFVHDRGTGETTRVSVATTGEEADYTSSSPSISWDGRFVAFSSHAHNLVPGPFQGTLFVHDRQTGVTQPVGFACDGSPANGAQRPSMSGDGRHVAFYAIGGLDFPPAANAIDDILVRDLTAQRTTRANVSSTGAPGNLGAYGGDWRPAISRDGRYVAFDSCASNLIPGDTNGASDVFRHDRAKGETVRLSEGLHGGGDDHSYGGVSISADGQVVAFRSSAENLVPGDANGVPDIFVADFGAPFHAPPFLYWADKPGYENDGVEPDKAPAGEPFTFKVNLTDPDGDEPTFVRLVLTRDGEPYGTFNMRGASGSTGRGRVYRFTRRLPAGAYTYRFMARDEDGEATGQPRTEKRGPLMPAPPHLEWTGQPGYESDGVDPDRDRPPLGRFVFCIRLTDLDDDWQDAVRVVLTKDGSAFRKYPMWLDPTHYPWGPVYTSYDVYLRPGNYAYRFEAEDDDGSATGEPTVERIGPIIPSPPYLMWQGGPGYEDDGVNPDSGAPGTTRFRFKVRCRSHEGTTPTYVRAILRRNGAFYRTLRMKHLRGSDPVSGIVYVAARRLPAGSYSHAFRAANARGVATGPATVFRPGPTVGPALTVALSGLAAVPTRARGIQVTFALSAPASVSAEVLNVAGRVVGTIARGVHLSDGIQTLVWTGRTTTGARAPNGAYVIRLRCRGGDGTESCHLATVWIGR